MQHARTHAHTYYMRACVRAYITNLSAATKYIYEYILWVWVGACLLASSWLALDQVAAAAAAAAAADLVSRGSSWLE